MDKENDKMMDMLKNYFEKRQEVVFAYLFGSALRKNFRQQGDIDIAVYFWPAKDIEWENFGKKYQYENKISLELERLLKKEVDLIVLNRARSILADEILRRGEKIIIKDRGIWLDFFCIVSDEAEYMRNWLIKEFRKREIAGS
jgi:predicted nucleotidyltransferase